MFNASLLFVYLANINCINRLVGRGRCDGCTRTPHPSQASEVHFFTVDQQFLKNEVNWDYCSILTH